VARAVPLVGMTLAAAIPLRAGIVNLGADGQLVLGGCAAAIVALYLPAPDSVRLVMALTAGMAVSAPPTRRSPPPAKSIAGVPLLCRPGCSPIPRRVCAAISCARRCAM
jgi:hypothetical protein